MEYLIFRLYGSMASWGEAAVGETRPSATYPGRSAIIGLLAAALGIPRHEEARLARLRDSVLVAVKQSSPGTLVRDYHTAQVPGTDRRAMRATRRDELALRKDRLHTILSSREYRCDGYWSVAVRLTESAGWSLEELARALRSPCFHLYLGRKSCPLAAPLVPQVLPAAGLRAALGEEMGALTGQASHEERRRLGIGADAAYAWEGEAGDLAAQQTRYVSDQPLHRGRWQFASRPEYWHHARED